MKGHVLLSHGLESGPQASKVTALAKVAEQLGFRSTRPDYRDLDATRDPLQIDARIARLREYVQPGERLILAGSSLGAFISGLASLQVKCEGLFLIALPLVIPGYAQHFAAAQVPTLIVHGWSDELIPVADVVNYAKARRDTLLLVNDTHRLADHVQDVATTFAQFLARFQ